MLLGLLDFARFLSLGVFVARAALYTIGRTTSDALAAEVVLVGEGLRNVDLWNGGRNAHWRRQNLEALRRRRRLDLGQFRHFYLELRRLWLGLRHFHLVGRRRRLLLGGRRRLVVLDRDEVERL